MESTFQHQAANDILNELFSGSSRTKDTTVEFSRSPPIMPPVEVRQLFIGNLPFRVRWQDIKDLFRKAGHVIRADVALNYDNRSKGHGTVLFTCKEDAQKAIDMYNGYKWNGRILEVRGDRGFTEENEPTTKDDEKLVTPVEAEAETVAVEAEKVDQKEENAKVEEEDEKVQVEEKTEEIEQNEDDDCKQVFVGNLPFHCQWQDLKDLFKSCGRILRADVVLNVEGRSRGFGTVLFSLHQDAKNAIEKYNGFEFHNRILRVHFDKFAVNHQRLREQEANSFGQRQIYDPASIELLRQTYLPQPAPQPQQLYGFSSFMPPAPAVTNAYYNVSNNMGYHHHYSQPHYMTQQQQQLPSFPSNNDIYAYHQQPVRHSPSFTTTATTTTATATNQTMYNTNPVQWMQYQQPQPPLLVPQAPLPQQHQDISSLSTSLNNLNLSNNQHNTANTATNFNHPLQKPSAGLNKWI